MQALPQLYNTFIQLLDRIPNHPAILFHQAFRTARYDTGDLNFNCPEVKVKKRPSIFFL